MLGSMVRRRCVAAALAVGSAASAAALAKPSVVAASWGAPASKPPTPPPSGSGPDPRNAHSTVYMKQAVDGVLKHGMPSKENIKYRDGHCLAYDRATRNPRWVSRPYRPPPLNDDFQRGSFTAIPCSGTRMMLRQCRCFRWASTLLGPDFRSHLKAV